MPKTSKAHAMAFFSRAGDFFSAAEALFEAESGPKATSKWVYPIYFCYSHAVELALKAFFRSHNPEVEFGHSLKNLYEDCAALGLILGPNDRTQIGNVVTLLDSGNQESGFRYFMGPHLPDLAWTREVVGRLIEAVEPEVKRAEKEQPSGSGKVVSLRLIMGKPTKQRSKTPPEQ